MCLLLLGIVERRRGRLNEAALQFEECFRDCKRATPGSFVWGMAIARYYIGEIARQQGDRVTAVSNIRTSLQEFLEIGDPWTVGGCVGTLGSYLAVDGELEEAARLLGAAHGLETSIGVFLPPTETEVHEAAARDVRDHLGPDAFDALFAEGQAFSMSEAAARAMAVPMESPDERAARDAGGQPHPLRRRLNHLQVQTLRMLNEGLTVKEIARAEGRGLSAVYERIDRIKLALGLPRETTQLALLRFVDNNKIL
jgi:hypothetical protein